MKILRRDKTFISITILSAILSIFIVFLSIISVHHMEIEHGYAKGYIIGTTFILLSLSLFIYIVVTLRRYILQIEKSRKKLAETNARFEFAVNGSGDGLWDWNLLTNEIYFSSRWKEMLGYTDDELPNDFASWEDRVHIDDLEKTKAEILSTHKKPGMPYNGIHRLRHKDGHWVWILDRGQTIFDANGKAIRMIGFHTDITENKIQELEIKKLGTLLDNTINSVENLIFVKDSEFRYIESNKAFEKFIGLEKKDLLGKSDYELFDKEIAEFFRAKDVEMLDSKKSKENYEWVTYPDGTRVYFLTIKSPLYDKERNILGLVGNSVDLTKEELFKNKIKEQEDMMIAQSRHAAMGEMISMIAHQWRQPISVIAMDASNILVDIELETTNDAALKEISKSILKQTQELSKTIDDFRDFFKPDKVASDTLIGNVLDDTLAVIGKSLENNNIKIDIDVPQSLEIKTYSRELMQVLINIIKNAKEALQEQIQESKVISIVIEEILDGLKIQICDNAGGIKDNDVPHIFEPYFSTKDVKNGTGLGLYMSKTIIEKHLYGVLCMKNIYEGEMYSRKCIGTCFTIELPKSIDHE
ncbi:MAG: PAS domain S-box-containing protein [Sulfurimonas sp.]|jgi:PAS domain S-box-containing protein|uniref:sensor histidine kinase n=1 Tax=Sulfurimonas sp. TaxID=2022749 RepID=UPI0039E5F812